MRPWESEQTKPSGPYLFQPDTYAVWMINNDVMGHGVPESEGIGVVGTRDSIWYLIKPQS